jgi:hypothetical protein
VSGPMGRPAGSFPVPAGPGCGKSKPGGGMR